MGLLSKSPIRLREIPVIHTSTIADLLKKILIDNKGKINNATKKKLVNVLGKLIESNWLGANDKSKRYHSEGSSDGKEV